MNFLCRLEAYVDERYKDSLKNQGKAEQVHKQWLKCWIGQKQNFVIN